jgi:hypothetical protein
LWELLFYDPVSGNLIWKARQRSEFATQNAFSTWNARYANKLAGSRHNQGYIEVALDRKADAQSRGALRHLAHRIIWKMMTGEDPIDEVDHRNTTRSDNRWANLRISTSSENKANTKTRKESKTGLKGVAFMHKSGRFRAHIRLNGRLSHLGCFDTAAEAHEAYCEAAKKRSGEFFNPGSAPP